MRWTLELLADALDKVAEHGEVSRTVRRRLEFHYTPSMPAGSKWSKSRSACCTQCLDRRFGERTRPAAEVAAWENRRNADRASTQWMFTTQRQNQTRSCLPNFGKESQPSCRATRKETTSTLCGIAGSIGEQPLAPDRQRAALDSLASRGPDASGAWSGVVGETQVTLLHTRLSIIDLGAQADQPFTADDCVLIYNGEVYNYRELRRELEGLGHRFTTNSDTEVVLRAYRAWGADCLDRLDGMWAFALADLREGRILLSRDRFGEKPLFWWRTGGTLYFASEMKALVALAGDRPAVNADMVRRYLVNGYKALHKRSETWFSEVRALPSASFAWLTDASDPRPERYWALSYRPATMTMADAIAETRRRLVDAVETRLRADVPVAFCLSGGIDSSALASLAARHLGRSVAAFSILDRDERYDERANIQATVADIGCDWHPIETETAGFLDSLGALVAYHDAPVATISYYVHAFLSRAIREAGYKVAISGTAADEIFTGYYDHYSFWLAAMSGRPDADALVEDWRGSYGRHVRNPMLQDPMVFRHRPDERGHIYLNRALFNDWMVVPFEEEFSEEPYAEDLLRMRMMNELLHESVPVLLAEDDANSMRWSVENRSPYLARALVEFLYTVPSEHLIHDGYPKWLLRAAVPEMTEAVRRNRQKRGFNAAIDSLLDRKDRRVRERLLEPGPIFDIVRRDAMEDLLDADLTDNSFSKFAFSFVSAKLFLESDVAAGSLQRIAP